MKHMANRKFSRLYLQVSAIFILILIFFAGITIYISIRSAQKYSVEVNQKLNWNLAQNTVEVIRPQFINGKVNKETVSDIMHSMMAINPSVEVYLLNSKGRILSYVAPEKVVKLDRVSLQPITRFLQDDSQNLIFGDDPTESGRKKNFFSRQGN